jgi:hypothetical protein
MPGMAIPISYALAIYVAEQGSLQVVSTGMETERGWDGDGRASDPYGHVVAVNGKDFR